MIRLEAPCRSSQTISPATGTSPKRPRRAPRFPSPHGTRLALPFGRLRGSLASLRLVNHPTQKSRKHPSASLVAVVVAERVLVQVRLQVLGRNGVVDPADPALGQG